MKSIYPLIRSSQANRKHGSCNEWWIKDKRNKPLHSIAHTPSLLLLRSWRPRWALLQLRFFLHVTSLLLVLSLLFTHSLWSQVHCSANSMLFILHLLSCFGGCAADPIHICCFSMLKLWFCFASGSLLLEMEGGSLFFWVLCDC